jgi:hypothetical protein
MNEEAPARCDALRSPKCIIVTCTVHFVDLNWLDVAPGGFEALKDLEIRTHGNGFSDILYGIGYSAQMKTRVMEWLQHAPRLKRLDLADRCWDWQVDAALPAHNEEDSEVVEQKSLILRDFWFATTTAIDWTMFGLNDIERLSVINCYR